MQGQQARVLGEGGAQVDETMDIVVGILVTFALHGAVIVGMAIATMSTNQHIEEYIEPKMLEFEDVELLALGEERPPDALPRIANPAPRTRAPDEVALNKSEDAVPLKKKKEERIEAKKEDRRKNLLDELDDLHDPDRPTNDDAPAGHADDDMIARAKAAIGQRQNYDLRPGGGRRFEKRWEERR